MQSIGSYVQGRTVMVTGAGGSIGSDVSPVDAFCTSEILLSNAMKMVCLRSTENLGQKQNETEITPLIGDMTDAAYDP